MTKKEFIKEIANEPRELKMRAEDYVQIEDERMTYQEAWDRNLIPTEEDFIETVLDYMIFQNPELRQLFTD